MKWIAALFVLGALSGCVSEPDAPGFAPADLKPGAYAIYLDEQPTWTVENGSAKVLMLQESQERIGSLFLDNTTKLSPPLAEDGVPEMIIAIIEGGIVKVEGVRLAEPIAPSFVSVPLHLEDFDALNGLTDFAGLNVVPGTPLSVEKTYNFGFAVTHLRMYGDGAHENLHVQVSTARGQLAEFQSSGSTPILPSQDFFEGFSPPIHQSAIGGTNLTVTVEAENFHGNLIMEAIGFKPGKSSGKILNAVNYETPVDISFKFGELQVPSRVDLHRGADFLFLEASTPSVVHVFDENGIRTEFSFNGTIAIPAISSYYALVPVSGTVIVGSDEIPRDFEMRVLERKSVRISSGNGAGGGYQTSNHTLDGFPYKILVDQGPGTNALPCQEGGHVSLQGHGPQNDGQSLAYFSNLYGADTSGLRDFQGKEIEVSKFSTPRQCDEKILILHMFLI